MSFLCLLVILQTPHNNLEQHHPVAKGKAQINNIHYCHKFLSSNYISLTTIVYIFLRFISHRSGLPNEHSNLGGIRNQSFYWATTPTGPGGSFRESITDDIQSKLMEQLAAINAAPLRKTCKWGEIECRLSGECILAQKWCDATVDCFDASDELQCTCKQRLNPARICDGYIDCPDASDEVGCFGCDPLQISCFHDNEEFIENNQRRWCYSKHDRCDGHEQCFNGKDEEDCSRIVMTKATVRNSA